MEMPVWILILCLEYRSTSSLNTSHEDHVHWLINSQWVVKMLHKYLGKFKFSLLWRISFLLLCSLSVQIHSCTAELLWPNIGTVYIRTYVHTHIAFITRTQILQTNFGISLNTQFQNIVWSCNFMVHLTHCIRIMMLHMFSSKQQLSVHCSWNTVTYSCDGCLMITPQGRKV
jgi:hypothetical protein